MGDAKDTNSRIVGNANEANSMGSWIMLRKPIIIGSWEALRKLATSHGKRHGNQQCGIMGNAKLGYWTGQWR